MVKFVWTDLTHWSIQARASHMNSLNCISNSGRPWPY